MEKVGAKSDDLFIDLDAEGVESLLAQPDRELPPAAAPIENMDLLSGEFQIPFDFPDVFDDDQAAVFEVLDICGIFVFVQNVAPSHR
jgi:hypothetical protein